MISFTLSCSRAAELLDLEWAPQALDLQQEVECWTSALTIATLKSDHSTRENNKHTMADNQLFWQP